MSLLVGALKEVNLMALQTLPAMEYESVNPFDGKTLETFVAIIDAQLEKKIATAQACPTSDWAAPSSPRTKRAVSALPAASKPE
jgi:hypothetical protein